MPNNPFFQGPVLATHAANTDINLSILNSNNSHGTMESMKINKGETTEYNTRENSH